MGDTEIILTFLIVCFASTCAQRRLIKSLPRLTFEPDFAQYSGYLNTLDNDSLFYWFVEASTVPPSQAPLMLWLNGGPGCSSVGGLLMSNGPFLANDRAELVRNEFSWNREVNVLYIDSPVGVGLSSHGRLNRSLLNDNRTTAANAMALLHFYRLFPEYFGRDLYLAGESYAGIYLPLLACELLEINDAAVNLKGVSIGNGLLVPVEDSILHEARRVYKTVMGLDIDFNSMQNLVSINSYNCASPCHLNPTPDAYPCLNATALVAILNDRGVRRALGVRDDAPEFVICQHRSIFKKYAYIERNVVPELERLVESNVSVLLYHGHLDFLIPADVTQRLLLKNLSPDIRRDRLNRDFWLYCRRAFNSLGPQIGGHHRSYGGGALVYRTVLGAGHSVATDLPEAAYQLLLDLLRPGNRWSCRREPFALRKSALTQSATFLTAAASALAMTLR